jgi:hypothetical protein
MTTQSNDYTSYLMRLWKTQEGDGAAWRITLEDTRTGCRWQFGSLEAMVAFLKRDTAAEPASLPPLVDIH